MLLLATLLSFGWPAPRVEFGPPRALHAGERIMRMSHCCGSMEPMIHGGEMVYVSPLQPGEKTLGLFVATPFASHLVVAETKNAVKTSGIHNRYSDGWTLKKDIRFVIRYVVRP